MGDVNVWLPEINRRGPALVEGDTLRPLSAAVVASLRMSGAVTVDVRPIPDFGAGHEPGSVSIELRPVLPTWLGWLIAPDKPLVIVRNPDQDPAEIVWQARKIGYDLIAGELDGGMSSWTAAGQPTSSIPLISAEGIGAARVLDVRQDSEYASGHLPAADHIGLGALAGRVGDLPAGPIVVMCGHGQRAMSAGSVLARAGRRDVAVLAGGSQDWAESTGQSLEVTS